MEMPIVSEPACAQCGEAMPAAADAEKSARLCRTCRMAPPPFERAVAYGIYEHRMRDAIHALKYGGMHPAARRLGRMLAEAMLKLAGDAPLEMLVLPVPLHRTKSRLRGFNQARALAEYGIAALRSSHPEWKLTLAPKTLMRLRATDTQAGLSPRQRRLNVRGAFQVSDPDAVRDRDILLVDDIFTTGATARAASLTLKRAGARSVWVVTLARAARVFPAGGSGSLRDEHDEKDQDEKEDMMAPGTLDTPGNATTHSFVEII
jgi:ComF family protein